MMKFLTNSLFEFRRVGKIQKFIIITLLVVSFVFGIAGPATYQKLTYNVAPTPTPSATPIPLPAELWLTSNLSSTQLGATISAIINIDSPNQGVEAADFVLDFDPNYLSVATISSGNYFSLYPIKNISSDSAKISGLANLINKKFIIPIGKGTIGTVTFNTLQSTSSTSIRIDKIKTIIASGGKNILNANILQPLNIGIR
ncbi:cohesin domain-containing protein [Patescibacteria group bacterium]|nr:cohesin domain-containing protein [Patescibacteria group bacterium]MCL5798403.1 cohesin domain-containing protein [Patescibacteria group bacterium]